jgi:hypothetical protein
MKKFLFLLEQQLVLLLNCTRQIGVHFGESLVHFGLNNLLLLSTPLSLFIK